jgi:hypothetical protein
MREMMRSSGLDLLTEKKVFAYRSPTQGIDTFNRLVVSRRGGAADY